ncbi:PSD1 and planctomycete cytochrome C domain-containing protein [Rubinisphaera margarita]|uniref:PSD1 and planctomycete cytochrome C domain-containing protein n=1 Tax=Rubinisphaera margarita TaxID=2909586 RepID=UPI001EE81BFA|nr:PSD1 and planctomycete cytochrome C domain-containing protein [Rubinisphaera margarita]MCG6154679.1 PSD1 and planctomycete cytochrome C domain-containing protein [Rubinisphaera margarita]
MKNTVLQICVVLCGLASHSFAADLDFNRDIRPILSDKCIGCHGPDEEHREADLRLDERDAAFEDRGGYAAIVPGKPEESELIARILETDHDLKMPPEHSQKSLTPEDIDKLQQWIAEGAEWEPHWAYVTPELVDTPEIDQPEWSNNFIDNFVAAEVKRQGMTFAGDADPVTLLRRVCFDLTGLPPTLEMVDAFEKDHSPAAVNVLIDELLASEHYGERMAMVWLDLVRYADTVGYHGDQDHSISPYRDWVINAFNDNMKFDQFTREQLAGDLMEDSGVDELVASGYNRLLQTTHEGGLQQKEYLAIYAADRVRNVSAVWMGATVGCAQCHTHKYDPYTITDFYSLAAFFADLDEAKHFTSGGNSLPTKREPEMLVLPPELREERARLVEEKAELAKLASTASDDSELAEQTQQIAEIDAAIKEIEKSGRLTMISKSIEPRVMRVLPRGNWMDDSGPIVEPAVPEFLPAIETSGDRATRLDLANWLVDDENGVGLLTARVMVNRLWAIMFGRGLADLTDFGGQGKPPTHPELLDRLAIEFVESGWDIKHMMRLMAQSRIYQLSSLASVEQMQRDPDNKYYSRQSRFRLHAEMVRDNALAVSGLLVTEIGGRSARPYQPAGYYRHLNFPTRKYVADKDTNQWRRGVYMHWQRQFLHPMLKAFDAPSREECTAERPRSNTPLAALTLLNDDSFVEAARMMAARVIQEGGETEQSRLDYACRLTMSRTPDESEQQILTTLRHEQHEYYQQHSKEREQVLQTGLAKSPEDLDPTELAAWMQVCRVLLNLSEVTTRN